MQNFLPNLVFARDQLLNGSEVTVDGSWSHWRNAAQCVVSVIDGFSKNILDIEVVELGCANYRYGKKRGAAGKNGVQ